MKHTLSFLALVGALNIPSHPSAAANRSSCSQASHIENCLQELATNLLTDKNSPAVQKYNSVFNEVERKEGLDRAFIGEIPLAQKFNFKFEIKAPHSATGISEGNCLPYDASTRQMRTRNVSQVESALKKVTEFLAIYHAKNLGGVGGRLVDIVDVQFCDKERLENERDFYYADQTLYVGIDFSSTQTHMPRTTDDLVQGWNSGQWLSKLSKGPLDSLPGKVGQFFRTSDYKGAEGIEVAVGDLLSGTPVLWSLVNPLSRVRLELKYILASKTPQIMPIDLSTYSDPKYASEAQEFAQTMIDSIAQKYELNISEKFTLKGVIGYNQQVEFYNQWRAQLQNSSIYTDLFELLVMKKLADEKEKTTKNRDYKFLSSLFIDARSINCNNQIVNSKNIKTFVDLSGGTLVNVADEVPQLLASDEASADSDESQNQFEVDIDIKRRTYTEEGQMVQNNDIKINTTSSKELQITLEALISKGDNCINLVDNVETQVKGIPGDLQLLGSLIPTISSTDIQALAFKRALAKFNGDRNLNRR